MIILDATDKSLEVVLGGAVDTNELDITCHAVDTLDSDQSVSDIVNTNALTNGATPVEAMAAPASGHTRVIKSLTVFNGDTDPVQITVQLNEGGTRYKLTRVTIDPEETLVYSSED